MKDEQHLVLFHVGPVQEFISTARTGQDLWFGSWLLSEMAKACALEVVKSNGNDPYCLIFPAATMSDLNSPDFNAPNRVLAVVSGDPDELAGRAKESVLRLLDRISDEAFRSLNVPLDREVARRQVMSSFEFLWASVPLDTDYARARALVDSLLAARKMTRDFAPVSWGSATQKCTLDGIREAVVASDGNGDSRVRFRLRRGEHLCGVCLMKRFGRRGSRGRFLSTSHLAALPLLSRMREERSRDVSRYVGRLQELGMDLEVVSTVRPPHPVFGPYDGEILFEERLGDFFQDEGTYDRARTALREFLKGLGVKKPLAYYAVLQADGDYMGEVVDSQGAPDGHRRLSRAQSEFAKEAGDIVERHEGCLIYSGGDDVLALLPLHTVLRCVRELSDRFRERLSEFRRMPGSGAHEGASPTLSTGVVVAHHLEPLSDVLRSAHDTLRAAKSVPGKGGLAVTLRKRSGEARTVAGKWNELVAVLEELVEMHRQDAVPDGASYELRELVDGLATRDEALVERLNRVAYFEAQRILKRKRAKRGTERISDQTLEVLKAWFGPEERCMGNISRLADALVVARVLADAAEMAAER